MTDKKTELKRCPFCGSEATLYKRDTMCLCENQSCVIYGVGFTVAEWNRRFVCLDKNGEKVFEGDNVRHCGHIYVVAWEGTRLRYELQRNGHDWTAIFPDMIELIKDKEII